MAKYKSKFLKTDEVEAAGAEPIVEATDAPVDDPEPAPAPVKAAGKKIKNQRQLLNSFEAPGDVTDIWERRILNPRGTSTPRIRLKDPNWHLRWINLANSGRYQRARYDQGWLPVERHELVDEREIFGITYSAENYVCRGEKGSEMLMKIPEAVFRKIREREVALNASRRAKLKSRMASASHQHFAASGGDAAGNQAAEAMSNLKGTIRFGTETVSADDLG